MKVTVLIENTTDSELTAEHGLSLLIEDCGRRILLDAGSTEAFYDNAGKLNVDLSELDVCVLSHGHYDHSGGYEALFRNNESVKVHALCGVTEEYFSGNGGIHYIGVPMNVLAYRDRFVYGEGVRELFEGVYLIPHRTPGLEGIGERSKLYRGEKNEMRPDDFAHEQSLVFDTEKGMVIFNSCSHGGVENIIREAKEVCSNKRVYAYVGGFHMKGKHNGEEICTFSQEELDALCSSVCQEGVSHIYTGHCTGAPGVKELQTRLGERVHLLTTGLQFIL